MRLISKKKKKMISVKAPLYTHMHATLLGLTTIRSHGGETLLVAEFDKYQDRHTGVWFLKIMTDCGKIYKLKTNRPIISFCTTF